MQLYLPAAWRRYRVAWYYASGPICWVPALLLCGCAGPSVRKGDLESSNGRAGIRWAVLKGAG